MHDSPSNLLLQRVAARQTFVAFARKFRWALLGVGVLYLLLLAASRLFALIPGSFFTPATLLVIPLLAALVALALTRRPTPVDAARLVDRRAQTKDLFLTATLVRKADAVGSESGHAGAASAVDYRSLVFEDVERAATGIKPTAVIPFAPWPGAAVPLAAVAAVALALFFLPQFDPFGKQKERDRITQKQKRLEESARATKLRTEMLARTNPAAELSKPVELGIEDFKKALGEMRKNDPSTNLKKLGEEQKNLGELWRKSAEQQLKNAANPASMQQKFGRPDDGKASEWKKELAQGDTSALDKELNAIKEEARKLTESKDAAQQKAGREELNQRLQNLAEFMDKQSNSQPMKATLQRAMEQLETGKSDQMTGEAMEQLAKTMDLSQMELQQLAQSIRDAKELEKALKTLQLAKANGGEGGKEGEGDGQMSLDEYKAMFEKLLAAKNGKGKGMGPAGGQGEGGVAQGDDTKKTDFKNEQSQSAMTAGKILMQWKTKGMSEAGKSNSDYQQQLNSVKQGVSEALTQEQVPPEYRETIQKYFDTMTKTPGAPSAPEAPPN